MDTRYFKLAASKERADQDFIQARTLHKEELSKEGANKVEVAKSLSKGHKLAANDAGENMRMHLYLSHEVRHPDASKRNLAVRTTGSLGLMCGLLMSRQFADVVRGT